MNRFLLYINEILESLDIPTSTLNTSQKKTKTPIRNRSKTIHLEEK